MKKLSFIPLITVLIALLISAAADAAINVDYVGPSSGELDRIIAGNTHYGQAGINQPYRVVFWYVKSSPCEAGFGTLVDTDYGDGSAITSYFQYTFNSGSSTGEAYEITAEVFPVDGQEDPEVAIDSDSDSYTVTVYDEFTVPIESVTYCEDTNEFHITYSSDVDWVFLQFAMGMQVVSAASAQVMPIEDPNTGAPPAESGFRPKRGNPKTKDGGWIDKKGNVWRKDPSGHAGPHWDVSFPKGGYINVMPPTPENPRWKVRGGNVPNEDASDRRNKIEDQMNQSSGSWFSPSRLLTIAGGLGAGYLIYKGGKTLIGIALLPTPAFAVGGVLILTP